MCRTHSSDRHACGRKLDVRTRARIHRCMRTRMLRAALMAVCSAKHEKSVLTQVPITVPVPVSTQPTQPHR